MYIKLKGVTPKEYEELMKIAYWNTRLVKVRKNPTTIGNCTYVFSMDAIYEIREEDCFDVRYTQSEGFVFTLGLYSLGHVSSNGSQIIFAEDDDL